MKLRSEIKHQAKQIRYNARRVQTALRWGQAELARMPVVIGNSMPKSGSHLIIQILEGLSQIGPFVNPGFPPLNRDEENTILQQSRILKKISSLRSGDICYSYLPALPEYISALTERHVASCFVYRDPRDMIISHVFYATEMHQGHQMHEYYNRVLTTMEQRINAAIDGVDQPGLKLTAIRQKYENYLGWMQQRNILCLRFEDLINERASTIRNLLNFLSKYGFNPADGIDQAVTALSENIQPTKSGTFRKGQTGNWKEHFTAENIRNFKAKAGDVLIRLGYETTPDW